LQAFRNIADTRDIIKGLAVADPGNGEVEILNHKYKIRKTITQGLNYPDAAFIDRRYSLYVSNFYGKNVQEYVHGSTTPSFTYSTGLTSPVAVSVDRHGNVFVADFGNGSPSVVVEYPQGSNTPSATCNTGFANEGIAVVNGAVFVSAEQYPHGYLIEFPNGLSGCHSKLLPVTVSFAGGLEVDNHKNLLWCDEGGYDYGGVDILAPPYTSVSRTLDVKFAARTALNGTNTLIFVTQPSVNTIAVDKYPSGTPITTLGQANGLNDPYGVAAWPRLP
jgi:hypothetical protein